MMIIGLVGFIGSGKGTIARTLESEWGYTRESFAKPLKDAVSVLFNWDRELLEGETEESRVWRETPDPHWSSLLGFKITPRWALQKMGTEMVRDNFHDDFWVKALEHRLNEQRKYVISDVRFPNEIEFINSLGGYVVQVDRGPRPNWYDEAENINTDWFNSLFLVDVNDIEKSNQLADVHYSEWAWIGHPKIDYYLDNTANDITVLKKNISSMCKALSH